MRGVDLPSLPTTPTLSTYPAPRRTPTGLRPSPPPRKRASRVLREPQRPQHLPPHRPVRHAGHPAAALRTPAVHDNPAAGHAWACRNQSAPSYRNIGERPMSSQHSSHQHPRSARGRRIAPSLFFGVSFPGCREFTRCGGAKALPVTCPPVLQTPCLRIDDRGSRCVTAITQTHPRGSPGPDPPALPAPAIHSVPGCAPAAPGFGHTA